MKKILFPTDFSEAATNAFIHALEFAKIVNAELILLHTFEIPVYDSQFFLKIMRQFTVLLSWRNLKCLRTKYQN